uniref:Uncharacterized protein n=1 Tax=Fagus sylvatica TaxID=28930 RepID=A0A2N9FIB8_FAGSY
MDVLLGAGLETPSISSCSHLPQLGGRSVKANPFGEPQNPNRMASDVMDKSIRPLVNKLFAWMGP